MVAGSRQILVVDDDEALSRELKEQLVLHDDFEVTVVHNGKDGIDIVQEREFDILLLDVCLPDIDGREVCKRVRKLGVKFPIIMLTGNDTEADEILGLDAGANDYITKPFRLAVLLARLRAHFRQFELSDDAVFRVGPFDFKPAAKMLEVRDGQRKIHLTEKETAIMKYLYRVGDVAVSRDVLLNEVWGYNAEVTTHTLETHIYRLRQKIEPDSGKASVLVTESGGYRLIR